MTCSFKAWVAELDGKPEGIIGLALLRPVACLFSAFNEPLRPYLKTPAAMRLVKKAQAAVQASAVPVWAAAEATEEDAPRILGRLGFSHAGEFDGDVIYEWRPA